MPDSVLAGVWLRDEQASDMTAYKRSLTHCMRLSGLEKETATRLFEGMQIQHDDEGISVQYLTVVPFFQVTNSWQHGQFDRLSAYQNLCSDLASAASDLLPIMPELSRCMQC